MAKTKTKTKTKTNGTQVAAVPEGYAQLETAGNLKGEWVKPGRGTVFEGKLVRAFNVEQSDGKITAAYAIQADGEEVPWLVGERAAFAEAFRNLTIGTRVYLRFDEQVKLMKNDKPTGKTMWQCTVGARDAGNGQLVREVLARSAAKPATEHGGGDVPF